MLQETSSTLPTQGNYGGIVREESYGEEDPLCCMSAEAHTDENIM